MRFHPRPELFQHNRRNSRYRAAGAPVGPSTFDTRLRPGNQLIYGLFHYGDELFLVQVPDLAAWRDRIPQQFPGLESADIELHWLSTRQHRWVAQERIVYRRPSQETGGTDLWVPEQTLLRTLRSVQVRRFGLADASITGGTVSDFLLEMVNTPGGPEVAELHRPMGIPFLSRCQQLTVYADQYCQADKATLVAAEHIYRLLGWSTSSLQLADA